MPKKSQTVSRITSGGNLWRLKETGCIGILPFGGLHAPKRRKFSVRLTAPEGDWLHTHSPIWGPTMPPKRRKFSVRLTTPAALLFLRNVFHDCLLPHLAAVDDTVMDPYAFATAGDMLVGF